MQADRQIRKVQTPPEGGFGPISQTDIVRFAGAGGDFNPLHHDREAAQSAGFDRPIAMGQFVAALMSGWISDWYGIEDLLHFEVAFRSPVYVGDILSFTAVVDGPEKSLNFSEGTAQLELTARVGDRVVVTGRADLRYQ